MTSETQTAPDSASRDYAPYDPATVETRVYDEWMRQGLFKPKSEEESGGPAAVRDHDAAAERHRRAAHRPRACS